uniref:Uncharacterized protein n=1 Tax=Fagus sylvatica TaxID=28930 RepID=A0A2N9GSM0_FAGSY
MFLKFLSFGNLVMERRGGANTMRRPKGSTTIGGAFHFGLKGVGEQFWAQANQPRVEVQMGEGMENGQNRPILGDFGDPIEERRNEGNNARFMPQFQGHFDAPYEEPWLGMRQGRQQGQQGQQALLELSGDFGDSIVESLCGSSNARPPPSFEGQFVMRKGFQGSKGSKHSHKGMLVKLGNQGMLHGLKVML